MTDSENSIICYLDILGYGELVKKSPPDKTIIYKNLQKIIEGKYAVSGKSGVKPIADAVEIQIISDSILLTLDLNNPPVGIKYPKENEKQQFCAHVFLTIVGWVCFNGLYALGHLLRGAITKGQHYQQSLYNERNQFIFSKALVEATELEKVADVPRILLSADLQSLILTDTSFDYRRRVSTDSDGLSYLDIYACSLGPPPVPEDILQGIRAIAKTMRPPKNISDLKVLRKYYWFQNYHNVKIQKCISEKQLPDSRELLIEL